MSPTRWYCSTTIIAHMIFFSDIEGATQDIPYIIVGDAAFPLRTNLLRPYPERNLPNIVTNSSYSVS